VFFLLLGVLDDIDKFSITICWVSMTESLMLGKPALLFLDAPHVAEENPPML
jgi:hypothetical protein